jgi:hypothetical protein
MTHVFLGGCLMKRLRKEQGMRTAYQSRIGKLPLSLKSKQRMEEEQQSVFANRITGTYW